VIHIDRMIDEMDDLEADLLMPFDVSVLENYYFVMDVVNDNGNWLGYVVHTDGEEIAVAYNASTGITKYRKDEMYYKFTEDAKKAFPLDSCSIDSATALLILCEENGWDDVDDN